MTLTVRWRLPPQGSRGELREPEPRFFEGSETRG